MGGIVAVVGKSADKDLEAMLLKLKHRGTMEKVIYSNSRYTLGELNLSHKYCSQELKNDYGVIFDGEPHYNKKILTREDLLTLYLDHGPDFVQKLEGSYAIIISHETDYLAARDLFGTKPLYYSVNGESTFFASEMKALDKHANNIKIFPPGHYYTKKKGLKKSKDIPKIIATDNIDISTSAIMLKNLLISAVEKALNENKNVGAFLSGGLDSSVIVATAGEVLDKKIATFAVGTENSDDIINARKAAEFLGTDHSEYVYTPQEMMDVLPKVIYHLESFDVELVNSSIANYLVSKIAKENGIKVILSGEGADELFAGYHYLKECKNDEELNHSLTELMEGLHNGGLQRVDRMTKAHSLECIMPFLDTDIVDFALSLPCKYKISEDGTEKWILRKAFSDKLPDEIVWRKKAQFGIGTGNEDIMEGLIAAKVSEDEFAQAKEKGDLDFKSKEEYFYYKIFKDFFSAKSIEKTVNRWLV